jgi:hypothetical protein
MILIDHIAGFTRAGLSRCERSISCRSALPGSCGWAPVHRRICRGGECPSGQGGVTGSGCRKHKVGSLLSPVAIFLDGARLWDFRTHRALRSTCRNASRKRAAPSGLLPHSVAHSSESLVSLRLAGDNPAQHLDPLSGRVGQANATGGRDRIEEYVAEATPASSARDG